MEKIEYSHLGVRNLSLQRNYKFKKDQFKVIQGEKECRMELALHSKGRIM